jgi:hypothetical protein
MTAPLGPTTDNIVRFAGNTKGTTPTSNYGLYFKGPIENQNGVYLNLTGTNYFIGINTTTNRLVIDFFFLSNAEYSSKYIIPWNFIATQTNGIVTYQFLSYPINGKTYYITAPTSSNICGIINSDEKTKAIIDFTLLPKNNVNIWNNLFSTANYSLGYELGIPSWNGSEYLTTSFNKIYFNPIPADSKYYYRWKNKTQYYPPPPSKDTLSYWLDAQYTVDIVTNNKGIAYPDKNRKQTSTCSGWLLDNENMCIFTTLDETIDGYGYEYAPETDYCGPLENNVTKGYYGACPNTTNQQPLPCIFHNDTSDFPYSCLSNKGFFEKYLIYIIIGISILIIIIIIFIVLMLYSRRRY